MLLFVKEGKGERRRKDGMKLPFILLLLTELKLLLLRYVNLLQQDKDEVRFPQNKEAGHTSSASETLPPSHTHGIEMVIR